MSKIRWKCEIHEVEFCAESPDYCPPCMLKIPMSMETVRAILKRIEESVITDKNPHPVPGPHAALVDHALKIAVQKFDESEKAFYELAEKYRHLKEIVEG